MPETSKEAEAPESADRFIDRVLSPEYVRSLMSEAGCDIRRGVFHPVMTLWLMMYQRISGRSSLAHALAAFREGDGSPQLFLSETARGPQLFLSETARGLLIRFETILLPAS